MEKMRRAEHAVSGKDDQLPQGKSCICHACLQLSTILKLGYYIHTVYVCRSKEAKEMPRQTEQPAKNQVK